MKTLEELAKEFAIDVRTYTPTEYVFTQDGIESLINEVISQRAGEPVGYISKDGFDSLRQGIYGASIFEKSHQRKIPVFLSANPSVIEYVKTLREIIKNNYPRYGDIGSRDVDVAQTRADYDAILKASPDSIKHLLT